MKFLLAFLFSCALVLANTCTLATGTYSTWASTAGHWTGTGCTGGSYQPAAPDIAVVPNGAALTIANGESVSLGSGAAGVGDALTVDGTSGSSFGAVTVLGTLTLNGFDETSNRLGHVQHYGSLTVGAGGTLIGAQGTAVGSDTATAPEGVLQCDTSSLISISGNSGSQATVTNAYYSWGASTSVTATGYTNTATVFPTTLYSGGNLYASWISQQSSSHSDGMISNSGGTGLGSAASTSLAFSAQSCTPTCTDTFLTTEVSSLDQVTSSGQYFVNYRSGLVYWWQASGAGKTVTFTATYKKLACNPWYINAQGGIETTYADFSYMGRNTSAFGGAIYVQNGTATNTSITHDTFSYVNRAMDFGSSAGSSGNPILISSNVMDCGWTNGTGYVGCIVSDGTALSYLDFAYNVALSGSSATTSSDYVVFLRASKCTNCTLDHNVIFEAELLSSQTDIAASWTGAQITSNVQFSTGFGTNSRTIYGVWGTSGSPVSITGNMFFHPTRAVSVGNYNNVSNNLIWMYSHHGVVWAYLESQAKITNVTATGNILLGTSGTSAYGPLPLGYNTDTWTDQASVTHNNLLGQDHNWTFQDAEDGSGDNVMTNITANSNLMTAGSVGVLRLADTSTLRQRIHISSADYNNVVSNTTNYSNWNRWSTATGISNVTGVSIQNPSAASLSGESLVWTYTSPTSITLAWGGGTPVSLVIDSQATPTGVSSTNPQTYYTTVTDTNKSWPTAFNNSACPSGAWLWVTGGTGAGQQAMIVKNTATTLTVVPALTTSLDGTSTYSIIATQVSLTAADSSTVEAGIYLPSTPTSTQTDSSVSTTTHSIAQPVTFAYAGHSAWSISPLADWDAAMGGSGGEWSGFQRLLANPALIDSAYAYMMRGFTPTHPANWCTGADKESTGAVKFCAAGKAMVGAIQ